MNWRLLLDEAASGAWNMAVDEALLLSQQPDSAPVLRFYDWNPPCVSIGRFQNASSFITCLAGTRPSSSPIVRRPTGGRAIWHQHEITYSVVLREEILPREARSVLGSYQWLSHALIQGLHLLGVQPRLAERDKELSRSENCFASAARSDFVVEGRKLIGAAQCRKNGAILQHGSLLLKVDASAWRDAVGGSMAATVSLEELGITLPRGEIITALRRGVQEVLDAQLQEDCRTRSEETLAAYLHSQKYTIDYWNLGAKEP